MNISVKARKFDPVTSKQAALDFTQTKAQKSVATVVAILSEFGPLTDFEIRDRWANHWEGPWSYTLPSKARHWAREAGLVKQSGYGEHQTRQVIRWTTGTDSEYLASVSTCPCCGQKVKK